MSNLLFVDYENRHDLDISGLDDSYQVIIFVGANQDSSKLEKRISEANTQAEAQFLKVKNVGRNSLDFYIAFKLGQVFEVNKKASCFILSGDKGFNALVSYINSLGMSCGRIESLDELPGYSLPNVEIAAFCCDICQAPMTADQGVYDDNDWICWGCLTNDQSPN